MGYEGNLFFEQMESSSLKQEGVKVDSVQSTLMAPKETSAKVVQVKKIPSEEGQTPGKI